MKGRRIDIDDDEVDVAFDQRLLYAGEPYTGEVVEHLAGSMVSLITYADGFKDGPYREWYENGTLRAEGVMRMGFVSGEFKRWHSNGCLARRMLNSEDGKTPLAEYEWDEEGRPTRTWGNTELPCIP
ncbi:toxin-antitoxin system YwqK family antitoxin [Streptomyces sp. NPDC018693]|uniref:toxin-antitoxin system YwqK family antitoxin n=1 Tax=unclassified Streptomyces TaxID=2593676 RepID=UPI00379C8BC1